MLARLQAFFNPPHQPDRAPRRIFWTALIVRLLYITFAHTYRIRVANDHFEFGWEMGRIARALATGHGYSDPFEGHTGPTAWTPPLYPVIVAAVFKLFGVYTRASAWVLLAVNSVFSAATAPAVYQIGLSFRSEAKESASRSLALWSAWLWALYPAAMQYAVKWVWDMSLTACLFAWVIVLALRLKAKPQLRPWLFFGLLWGLIALSNNSLLAFLPFCALWILWPATNPGAPPSATASSSIRVGWGGPTLPALLFLAVLSPWIIRNALVFHTFVPLRSNFGAELYESAQLENEGYPTMATLPHAVASPDFQRYRRLGELAYSREQGAQARQIIRHHPRIWISHIFRRIWFFWVSVPHPTEGTWRGLLNETLRELSYAFLSLSGLLGLALALRNKVPAAWLFFWAFVSIPLLYYAITVQARFRHPLEPLICVLAVYLFRSAKPRSAPLPPEGS
jgi:4-amino-4-deoxy-L-arabinose transferase-like glycosyltransferase